MYANTVKKLRYRASGVTLGTSDNSTDKKINSKTRSKREEEMYQARLRQQEILNQKAIEALKQQRELLKKKPVNHDDTTSSTSSNNGTNQTSSTIKKYSTKSLSTTTKSNSKTATTTGYNAMQPWSASASGGTYR